jgi:hypothetical protein
MKSAATIIGLICIAASAGCAHTPMLVTPSPEIRQFALSTLVDTEKDYVQEKLPFTIVASNPDLEVPKTEASNHELTYLFDIDWKSFFLESGTGETLTVVRAQALFRILNQESYYTPTFSVDIDFRRIDGSVIHASGRASGPIFKGGWSLTKDPVSIRSANIAFYGAYLKALAHAAAELKYSLK